MIKFDELKKNALFSSAYSYIIKNNTGANNPYHNNLHLFGVFTDVMKMCNHYEVEGGERIALGLAYLFHDFNHNGRIGNDDVNIEKSIEGFKIWMISLHHTPLYNDSVHVDTNLVERLIRTTEFPLRPNPKTIEEKIMMDADMMSTYRSNWFDTTIVGLSKEFGITIQKQISNQIGFVKNLTFYTGYAMSIHDKFKDQLIEELMFLKQTFN